MFNKYNQFPPRFYAISYYISYYPLKLIIDYKTMKFEKGKVISSYGGFSFINEKKNLYQQILEHLKKTNQEFCYYNGQCIGRRQCEIELSK